jgi:hypothetical protein
MSEETTEGLGSGLTEPPVQTESNVTESAPSVDFGSEDMYRDFVNSLPEEIRGAKALQETKDFTSLANQMLNAQSALGKKRLEVPQDDWTAEQWDEFHGKLRPENDEYEIPESMALPIELEGAEQPEFDDESLQELVDFAGQAGLTQQQFNMLYSRYGQMYLESTNQLTESQDKEIADYRTALQAEWQGNFDVNMKSSSEAFNSLAEEIPELNELVENPMFANHPATIKLFHRLSNTMSDTLPPAGSNIPSAFGSDSVTSIRSQIQDLDASHSELILSNPSSLPMSERSKRQMILDKRAKLYSQLYGEG